MCSGVRVWKRLGTHGFGAVSEHGFHSPFENNPKQPSVGFGNSDPSKTLHGLESGPGVWTIFISVSSQGNQSVPVPTNHGKVPRAHSQCWGKLRELSVGSVGELTEEKLEEHSQKQPGNLWILPSSWPRTGPSECRSASWCPSSRKPRWASRCSACVPSASTGETHLGCPWAFPGATGRTRSSFSGQGMGTGCSHIQQELSGDRAEILMGKDEEREDHGVGGVVRRGGQGQSPSH